MSCIGVQEGLYKRSKLENYSTWLPTYIPVDTQLVSLSDSLNESLSESLSDSLSESFCESHQHEVNMRWTWGRHDVAMRYDVMAESAILWLWHHVTVTTVTVMWPIIMWPNVTCHIVTLSHMSHLCDSRLSDQKLCDTCNIGHTVTHVTR